MDEDLKEAARKAPALVVLVVLVSYFLRALDRRASTIKSIAETCHASQTAATAAINENTRVLGKVGEALDAHRQVLADAVRDRIDRSALANCSRKGHVKSRVRNFVSVLVLAIAAAALGACAGLTPSAASPATAGAPATAGQLAQTVSGQQGQAPSTATGGTAAVNWYFASSVPSEVIGPILRIAEQEKWTAEQVAAAIKSANGAPQTVTITTTGNSASGSNASSIPAGTGGTAGVGGAGTVSKP